MAAPALDRVFAHDNRTVVASHKPDDDTLDVVASALGPDGAVFPPLSAIRRSGPRDTWLAGTAEVPSEDRSTRVTVPIIGPYDKTNLRTQFFFLPGKYDSTQQGFGAKRCFVNLIGLPLAANGTPTSVEQAADADTVTLSQVGEAVSNGRQVFRTDDYRSAWPGTYEASPLQTSLYVPWAGWTAQQQNIPVAP